MVYLFEIKIRFQFLIYLKMKCIAVKQSWIFSIITSVFSVTWSSEIILICWFIINVGIHRIIVQDSLINKKVKKNSVYSKYTFCVSMYTTIKKFRVCIFVFFLKESNTFISEGCVKWIKGDSKDLYCEKNFLFWTNAVLFNFVFIDKSNKSITCSKKQYEEFQHS